MVVSHSQGWLGKGAYNIYTFQARQCDVRTFEWSLLDFHPSVTTQWLCNHGELLQLRASVSLVLHSSSREDAKRLRNGNGRAPITGPGTQWPGPVRRFCQRPGVFVVHRLHTSCSDVSSGPQIGENLHELLFDNFPVSLWTFLSSVFFLLGKIMEMHYIMIPLSAKYFTNTDFFMDWGELMELWKSDPDPILPPLLAIMSSLWLCSNWVTMWTKYFINGTLGLGWFLLVLPPVQPLEDRSLACRCFCKMRGRLGMNQ